MVRPFVSGVLGSDGDGEGDLDIEVAYPVKEGGGESLSFDWEKRGDADPPGGDDGELEVNGEYERSMISRGELDAFAGGVGKVTVVVDSECEWEGCENDVGVGVLKPGEGRSMSDSRIMHALSSNCWEVGGGAGLGEDSSMTCEDGFC
jgi:hypothetical protein